MLGFGQHKNKQNFNLIRSSIVNAGDQHLEASGRSGEKTTSFKELPEGELQQLLREQAITLKKAKRRKLVRHLVVFLLVIAIVGYVLSKYHF